MGEKELSKTEAELYDRQIRLWGIESQEKLRAANVLLIGVRGLGSEVAKNIILCGINSLTFLDDGDVTNEELSKNFLLTPDSVGKKIAESILIKAQALNPLVKITIDTQPLDSKPEKFFSGFTIVIGTRLNTKQILTIDRICRPLNIKFIFGDVFGLFGYTLADFQEHHFYVDQVKLPKNKRTYEGKAADKPTTVKVHSKFNYSSMDDVMSSKETVTKESHGKRKRRNELYYLMKTLILFRDENDRTPSHKTKEDDLTKLKKIRSEIINKFQINEEKFKEATFNLVFGEVTSVCAIIGGVLAQEVIKAVSNKEVPIYNLFLFNPHTFSGKEERV